MKKGRQKLIPSILLHFHPSMVVRAFFKGRFLACPKGEIQGGIS